MSATATSMYDFIETFAIREPYNDIHPLSQQLVQRPRSSVADLAARPSCAFYFGANNAVTPDAARFTSAGTAGASVIFNAMSALRRNETWHHNGARVGERRRRRAWHGISKCWMDARSCA
jgi:hypothetical protein